MPSLAAPKPVGSSSLIAPSIGYDTPTLSWNSVANAVYYVHMIDALTGQVVVDNTQVAGSSFTPSSPLLAGHTYTWYVGSEGTLGAAGPVSWSTPMTFTLARLAAPTPAGPSGPLTASSGYDTPTYSWSSVPGVVSYNLVVEDAATGQVVVNNTLAGTSFTPGPTLLVGHGYVWYIGAEAAAGDVGAVSWSGPTTFTLAALTAPTLTGPSGTIPVGSGYQNQTLIWTSVPGAAQYRLYVKDQDATAGQQVVVDNSSLTVTSFLVTGLTPGHHYTWYVGAEGAVGGNGPIAWSTAARFVLASS